MANALGQLFGGIADAIREKSGETGTMKPAEFPEKIRSIETGGGSTLAPGCYWEPLPITRPSAYLQRWIVYQGELYAFGSSNHGNGYFTLLHKWVDGAWTTSTYGMLGNFRNPVAAGYLEYNGKLHIFGDERVTHLVFDGETMTKKADMPGYIRQPGFFVEDGILKAFSSSERKVYAWDEGADTWTTEVTLTSTYSYTDFHNVGSRIIAKLSNVLYEYSHGVFTELPGTVQTAWKGWNLFTHGGALYGWNRPDSKYGPELQRLNEDTQQTERLGRVPMDVGTATRFDLYGDLCWLLYVDTSSMSAYISPWRMHLIEDGE